jgi:ATP-dependent protease ClpP protease subunit
MFEVKIYGEIVPFQDTWIAENGYFNLTLLNQQLEKANGQPIIVAINSYGGDVEEGFAIYQALRRYADTNKVEVHTRCDGRCASIATVFFLAGDKRTVNPFLNPFVHNAWTYAIGDAKELNRIAVDLEAVNAQIATHYATHTNLTIEEARALMDADTYITPDECVAIRFATDIETLSRPKALLNAKNRKSKTDSTMKKNKSKIKGIFAKMEALFSGVLNLEVYTDANEVLDFYDLGDGDVPKIGDKANYKEKPAEGTFKLADGKTQYTFATGELTEIVEDAAGGDPSEDAEAMAQEIKDLKEEIAGLKTELEAAKASNTDETIKAKDSKIKALEKTIKDFKALKSTFEAALEEDDDKGAPRKDVEKDFSNFQIKR